MIFSDNKEICHLYREKISVTEKVSEHFMNNEKGCCFLNKIIFESIAEKPYFKEHVYKVQDGLSEKDIIEYLNEKYHEDYPKKTLLEVSTKSADDVGRALSAFNLKIENIPVENVYCGSKKFRNGGPYIDLIDENVPPKQAKFDERLYNSGELECFEYNNRKFNPHPSFFYTWLYINALIENDMSEKLSADAYMDVFYDPAKPSACQARACAIAKTILKTTPKENIKSFNTFSRLFIQRINFGSCESFTDDEMRMITDFYKRVAEEGRNLSFEDFSEVLFIPPFKISRVVGRYNNAKSRDRKGSLKAFLED